MSAAITQNVIFVCAKINGLRELEQPTNGLIPTVKSLFSAPRTARRQVARFASKVTKLSVPAISRIFNMKEINERD